MPHNRSEAATVDLRRALLGVRVDDEAAWSAARKALLSGADANVSPDDVVGYGRTVLMYAARSGRLEVLHLALACGAEVDRLDQGGLSMGWMGGWTALMRAAQGNHPDVITALIEHGANPNRCGQSGVSALMHAAIAGSEEALIRLLAHGAQPNLLSRDGWTALMHAARGGLRAPAIEALLAAGADPLLPSADAVVRALDVAGDLDALDCVLAHAGQVTTRTRVLAALAPGVARRLFPRCVTAHEMARSVRGWRRAS